MPPLPDSRGGPRIIELPLTAEPVSGTEVEPRSLAEVLRESADLLFQSQAVEDQTIRDSAVELAIRSLRAAAAAVDGRMAPSRLKATCRVPVGPWTAGPSQD